MLAQQHEYARKQPQQLFFEFRWRYWFSASKMIG
jgi:hypothetical protein